MFTREELKAVRLRVGLGSEPNLPAWYIKSLGYYGKTCFKYRNKKIVELGAEPPRRGRKKKIL